MVTVAKCSVYKFSFEHERGYDRKVKMMRAVILTLLSYQNIWQWHAYYTL